MRLELSYDEYNGRNVKIKKSLLDRMIKYLNEDKRDRSNQKIHKISDIPSKISEYGKNIEPIRISFADPLYYSKIYDIGRENSLMPNKEEFKYKIKFTIVGVTNQILYSDPEFNNRLNVEYYNEIVYSSDDIIKADGYILRNKFRDPIIVYNPNVNDEYILRINFIDLNFNVIDKRELKLKITVTNIDRSIRVFYVDEDDINIIKDKGEYIEFTIKSGQRVCIEFVKTIDIREFTRNTNNINKISLLDEEIHSNSGSYNMYRILKHHNGFRNYINNIIKCIPISNINDIERNKVGFIASSNINNSNIDNRDIYIPEGSEFSLADATGSIYKYVVYDVYKHKYGHGDYGGGYGYIYDEIMLKDHLLTLLMAIGLFIKTYNAFMITEHVTHNSITGDIPNIIYNINKYIEDLFKSHEHASSSDIDKIIIKILAFRYIMKFVSNNFNTLNYIKYLLKYCDEDNLSLLPNIEEYVIERSTITILNSHSEIKDAYCSFDGLHGKTSNNRPVLLRILSEFNYLINADNMFSNSDILLHLNSDMPNLQSAKGMFMNSTIYTNPKFMFRIPIMPTVKDTSYMFYNTTFSSIFMNDDVEKITDPYFKEYNSNLIDNNESYKMNAYNFIFNSFINGNDFKYVNNADYMFYNTKIDGVYKFYKEYSLFKNMKFTYCKYFNHTFDKFNLFKDKEGLNLSSLDSVAPFETDYMFANYKFNQLIISANFNIYTVKSHVGMFDNSDMLELLILTVDKSILNRDPNNIIYNVDKWFSIIPKKVKIRLQDISSKDDTPSLFDPNANNLGKLINYVLKPKYNDRLEIYNK